MRRKILIGLAVHTVLFLLAGGYIAFSIRGTTKDLDRLITLHRVELLRDKFLLAVRRVQNELLRPETSHAASRDDWVAEVAEVDELVENCFACHHSPAATGRLTKLKGETARYHGALRSIDAPEDVTVALAAGDVLTDNLRDMLDATAAELERRTQTAMAEIRRSELVLYALLGVGPLLSALLVLFWIRGLTRPLDDLLEATGKLRAGDLRHRVPKLADEFGELALSFNAMASSLQDQLQRMQRTEQMVVVGELAAGLAHEIKNPLAGIKAATQVLSAEATLSDEDRAVLKKVAREVTTVETLLKSFLNFARPASPHLVPVNVNGIVESVVAFHVKGQSADGSAPVRIEKVLGAVPETLADPVQIQQILLNLVLNALDAMPRGGKLTIRTDADPESIRLEVADTGRGVSPEHADKVFRPFFTTKPGGTGLGLPVSKRLIEQHGGTITLSPTPGGGATFCIHLPLRPAKAAAKAKAKAVNG